MPQHVMLGLLAAVAQPPVAPDDPKAEPGPTAPLPDKAATDAPPPVANTPAAVTGAKSYAPADFARFNPRTALDMVRNVPGFTIRNADESSRGLGQASGNVILNGERFSGKTNDVVTELGRIAVENVIRIDVVDGATLDIPGLSGQVVNIITKTGKIGGTFTYRPEIRTKRLPALLTRGEVSLNGKVAGADFTVSVGNNSRRNGNHGPEIVYRPDGTIIDRREEDLRINQETPKLSGRLRKVAANGNIWNVNGLIQRDRTNLRELSEQSGILQADRTRDLRERRRENLYEIGGDYELGLGGGRLKLIGLRRASDVAYSQLLTFDFVDATPDTGDRYTQAANEAETIARAEYRWKGGKADWQISLEGALNSLDVANALFRRDAGGTYQPLPFPDAVAKVEEKRGEAILSYGRPLSKTLTLQASAGAEYSELSQSGPAGLTRQFVRPKGQASLAWRPSPKTDVSLKVERAVGQLSFFDFVASANISAETSNAGNANLVPPQSWNVDLQGTRNLGAWGNTTARAYARFFSDIVDVIPIGATGQAPGNLDSAVRYGIQWTSTINFDPIGWKGVRLDADFTFQRSRLTDPLTGQKREINEDTRRNIDLNLRYDMPGTVWAYGVGYEEFSLAPGFRLDQRFRFYNKPGGLSVFVENKDFKGLTVRSMVYGLLNTNEAFDREFYNGRRTNGLSFTESRDRFYGLIFQLTVTGKI